MTTFDDRERAFENRFVHDEEERFRARARAVRSLAAWAANRMRRDESAATAYADDLVAAAVGGATEAALARKVADDLDAAGQPTSVEAVETEMRRLMAGSAPAPSRL